MPCSGCCTSNRGMSVSLVDYCVHLHPWKISSCTSFAALASANMKGAKGICVMGVVAVTCLHKFWDANVVGDLQKGERYAIFYCLSLT